MQLLHPCTPQCSHSRRSSTADDLMALGAFNHLSRSSPARCCDMLLCRIPPVPLHMPPFVLVMGGRFAPGTAVAKSSQNILQRRLPITRNPIQNSGEPAGYSARALVLMSDVLVLRLFNRLLFCKHPGDPHDRYEDDQDGAEDIDQFQVIFGDEGAKREKTSPAGISRSQAFLRTRYRAGCRCRCHRRSRGLASGETGNRTCCSTAPGYRARDTRSWDRFLT